MLFFESIINDVAKDILLIIFIFFFILAKKITLSLDEYMNKSIVVSYKIHTKKNSIKININKYKKNFIKVNIKIIQK